MSRVLEQPGPDVRRGWLVGWCSECMYGRDLLYMCFVPTHSVVLGLCSDTYIDQRVAVAIIEVIIVIVYVPV